MNIKEIIEAIKKSELADKDLLVDSLSKEISNRNDEAKQNRIKFEAATSMIKDFKDFVDVPDDIDDDGLSDYLIDKKAEGSPSDKELAKMQRKLSKIEGQLEAERSEKEQLKVATRNSSRDSEIASILASKKVRPETINGLKKMFGSSAEYEDEGWTYEGTELKEGISKYLEENPVFLATGQKEGTGSTNSQKKVGQSAFTYEQVKNMSSEERKQNMDAIMKSMKDPNWQK